MNVQVRDLPESNAQSRLAIADCDLHLGPRSTSDLYPYLTQRWIDYIETYGTSHRIGYQDGNAAYPKSAPFAARRDAFPPDGSPPGTNLDFTRTQHLDRYNIQLGLINPPLPSQSFMNPDLGNAMCHSLNHWQIDTHVRPEPRLRASIVINYEDPAAAVREIERCANIPGYGHVMFMSRICAPLGQRQYRPILQAATEAGFPVAMHAFGFAGHKPTAAGWPSFYLEDLVAHANAFQAHLASMVVELIELSRLQGAERLPDLVSVDVDSVVQEAISRHKVAADSADITISTDAPSGLQVLGDQGLLVTAVANLISNAIAYSPDSSTVSISRRHRGEEVEISVTDRGIGIALADQERVFERFFRVDKARSRATGGTGLGLAIVKHVAANHNGTIRLWSRPGTGSTFTLSIPAYSGADDEDTEEQEAQ